MPNKRVHPNKTFNKLIFGEPLPRVTIEQRARLKKTFDGLKTIAGLPNAALSELNEIAAFSVLYSLHNLTAAEMRAALKILLKRVSALRDDYSKTDLITKILMMNVFYKDYLGVYEESIADDLSFDGTPRELEKSVSNFDDTFHMLESVIKMASVKTRTLPFLSATEDAARKVRIVFKKFDIPFSLSNDSPAVSTVLIISNTVRPTKHGTVRNAVYSEMVGEGDKRTSPIKT